MSNPFKVGDRVQIGSLADDNNPGTVMWVLGDTVAVTWDSYVDDEPVEYSATSSGLRILLPPPEPATTFKVTVPTRIVQSYRDRLSDGVYYACSDEDLAEAEAENMPQSYIEVAALLAAAAAASLPPEPERPPKQRPATLQAGDRVVHAEPVEGYEGERHEGTVLHIEHDLAWVRWDNLDIENELELTADLVKLPPPPPFEVGQHIQLPSGEYHYEVLSVSVQHGRIWGRELHRVNGFATLDLDAGWVVIQ